MLLLLSVPAHSPLLPSADAQEQPTYYDDPGVGDSITEGFGFNVHTSGEVPDDTPFFVTVSPKAGSHEGCDANPDSNELAAKTYRVLAVSNRPVTVRFTASGQHAVRRPVGATVDCEYDVSFAQHEEGLDARYTLDTGSRFESLRLYEITPAMVLAGSRWVASGGYGQGYSRPMVQLRFPPGLDIAANEQPRFDVIVARTPDTPEGCDDIGTLRFNLSRQAHTGAHLSSIWIDPSWWPPGGQGACRYEVEFPKLVTVPGGAPFVPDPEDDDVRTLIHRNSRFARQRYIRDPLFDLHVEVAAPQNVPQTVAFEINVAAASGSHAECVLEQRTETVTIPRGSNAGSLTLTDLVRAPQGVITPCAYEITFPESASELPQRYAHDANFKARTLQIVHTSPTAQARYAFVSEFVPDVGLQLTSLPPAAVSGETFTVRYPHAADSPTSCKQAPAGSERWSVSQAGVPQPPAGRVVLASSVAGATDLCRYEVVWPDIAGLVKPTGDPPVLTVESPAIWGHYALDVSGAAAGSWTHAMEITLPFRDANDDGLNDYDPQFSFGVSPHESEVAEGPTCPRTTVEPRLSDAPGSQIIDAAWLSGMAQGCGLATEFPATIASGVPGITLEASLDDLDAVPPVDHDSHEEFTAGDGNHVAKVEYTDGRGVGRHGIEFRLPSRLPLEALDQEVIVRFVPKADQCRGHPDDYQEIWQIGADGRISRESDRAELIAYPAEGNFDDVNTYCEYEIVWPDIPELIKPSNRTFTFTRTGMEIEEASSRGSYAGPTYYPDNLARGVQLITTNGVPANTPFSVTISPKVGSHPGCDANPGNPETTKTYRMLSRNPWVIRVLNITQSGRHLVKRPAGVSRDCGYDVTFAPSEEGPTDNYIIDSNYNDRRTEIGNIVSSTYGITSTNRLGVARERYTRNPNPSTFFTATIEVQLTHNAPTAATFNVAVAPATGSPNGCSERPDLSVTVEAGANSASLSVTQLFDQISGETDPCSYVVSFDDSEDDGTTYRFDPRYDAPMTAIAGAAGTSQTARQRYTADTFFDGEVTVRTVENVTKDTTFRVSVAAASDAPMGCSDAVPDVLVTLTTDTNSKTAAMPTLVERATGASDDCAYVASFSEHEVGFSALYVRDVTFAAASTSITPASPTAQFRYTLNPAPSPTLDATVEVALTEAVSVDTAFSASIAPVTGAHEACVGQPSVTVTVLAGSRSATAAVTGLLELPLGEANPCAYEVTFAPDVIGEDAHWFPDATYTAVTTLTQGATTASQRYAPRVWLYPTTGPNAARVLVWVTDDVPDTVSFEATITAASMPTACRIYATSQVAVITLTVAAPASSSAPAVALFASDQQLVRRPHGATTDCTYTVAFADDETGTTANYARDDSFADIDTDITPASRAAQHRYARAATSQHWTMQMLIDLPFRDDDGDGANDYDPQFSIDVSPGPTSDSAGGACPTTTLLPRLDEDGDSDTVAVARLVGLAPGCEPTFEFPADIASGVAGIRLTLATMPPAQQAPTAASPQATATYVDGRTSFQPEVTINLPDPVPTEAVDEEIVVTFTATAASPAGCVPSTDSDAESWSITAAGASRDDATAVTLVGVPAGTTAACAYDITWPAVVGLIAPPASTLTFSAADVAGSIAVTAEYRARTPMVPFTPAPTVNLPVVDYDDDGAHDYAGARFTVTYARKSGEPSGCTEDDTEAIYEVQSALTSGETAVEVVGTAPSLTDAPMDSMHACAYDVTFSATAATTAEPDVALFALATAASDDADVSAAANDAQATYSTASQTQSVAFTADVEAGAVGETFTVTVSVVAPAETDSAFDGCTGVVRDPASGVVTASSFDVVLTVDAAGVARGAHDVVDWPAGHDAVGDRCAYGVAWPLTEDGTTTVYRRTGDATIALDATVFATSAPLLTNSYTSAAIEFDVTLRVVTAPDVPAGTMFSVAIAPANGAPVNCSEPPPLAIAAAAETVPTETVAILIDRPAGSIERCVYDVTWQPNTSGDVPYIEDTDYAERSTSLNASAESSTIAAARYHPDPDHQPANEPPVDRQLGDQPAEVPDRGSPQVNTPVVSAQPTGNTGGGPRTPSTGGGRTSGGTSRGGSGGGARGGTTSGGATGPWVVAATSRVPVMVSLAMPEREFAVGTAVEVMLNVPGTCGEDVTAFAGLPAQVGLVYALSARSGVTAQVLAANVLRLAGYAQRGEATRDCELRITLISAPEGCQLDDASADDAGRSYVELAGGADIGSYSANPSVVCR